MPKITFVAGDGTSWTADAVVGSTVMQAAVAEGVDGIVAECGGNAMCATCHVYVDTTQMDSMPPMQSEEDNMLDCAEAERLSNSRLSCQLKVEPGFEGLRLQVPDAG